jgi:hypothetical protein
MPISVSRLYLHLYANINNLTRVSSILYLLCLPWEKHVVHGGAVKLEAHVWRKDWQHCCGTHCISLLATQLRYTLYITTDNTVVVHTVYHYWQHCCGTHCISLLTTLLWYKLYITTDNTAAVHNTNSPANKYKHLLLNLGTIILTNIVSMFCQTVHVIDHCENAVELNVNIFTPT